MQMYANMVLVKKKTLSVVSYRKSDKGGNEGDDYNLLGIILRYYPLFLLSFFLNSSLTKRRCLAKFLKLRILV